jgi:predicted transcriptional regulator
VYEDLNNVRSDLSSDLDTKIEKIKLFQTRNSKNIEDASIRIIETSRSINDARAAIYQNMNEITDELESKIDKTEEDIENIKEDLTDIKEGNFTIGTNLLSSTISEINEKINKINNVKQSVALIQLFGTKVPMRPRGQKIPLHTGKKDYTFYMKGKLIKLVIQCNVAIQAFLNNNLLTVVNPDQPDDVNLNQDINEGDTLHFIPPSDHASDVYIEAWFEKS